MAQSAPVKPSSRQLERWDKKYIWHPFTQHFLWDKEPTLIVTSAKGPYFYDQRGRRFLDGVSSLWVNLHGHRHPQLDRAVKKQLSRMAHTTFLGLSHVPAIRLAKALASIAPKGLVRSFFSDSGATAVEIALKMAFQYWIEKEKIPSPRQASWRGRGQGEGEPLRTEFLALKGSYHGDTLGAVSVGGIGAFHSKFKPLLFKARFAMKPACYGCPFNKTGVRHRSRLGERVRFVPRPGQKRLETGCHWECLGDVEDLLKKRSKRLAAAIIEPLVQGASGMNVMPPGYLAGFKALCQTHGVLLIADEVATGFCRTGTLFACEQEDVTPDILCLAKSLTAGYSPLAVTMTNERIFRSFYGPSHQFKTFFHGHSYTAHPLGAAVAVANLRLISQSKRLEKTRRKAHLMKRELRRLEDLPHVGSIRQAGLMAGVELVLDKKTGKPYPLELRKGATVCRRLLSQGIWLRPLGDVIVLMPPPIISDADLRRLIRCLGEAILHEYKN